MPPPEKSVAFLEALKTRLTANAGLAAWAIEHFGKAFTMRDGIPAGELRDDEYPAMTFELAEADEEENVLGNDRVRVTLELFVFIVWSETASTKILAQRLQLHDLLKKAMLGDPTFGGTVQQATAGFVEVEQPEEPIAAMVMRVLPVYDLTIS